MKTIKKLLVTLLTLSMTLGSAVGVFAGDTGDASDIDNIATGKTAKWVDEDKTQVEIDITNSNEVNGKVLLIGSICSAHGMSTQYLKGEINTITDFYPCDYYLGAQENVESRGASTRKYETDSGTVALKCGNSFYTKLYRIDADGSRSVVGDTSGGIFNFGRHISTLMFAEYLDKYLNENEPRYIIIQHDNFCIHEYENHAYTETERQLLKRVAEKLKPYYENRQVIWLSANAGTGLFHGVPATYTTNYDNVMKNVKEYGDKKVSDPEKIVPVKAFDSFDTIYGMALFDPVTFLSGVDDNAEIIPDKIPAKGDYNFNVKDEEDPRYVPGCFYGNSDKVNDMLRRVLQYDSLEISDVVSPDLEIKEISAEYYASGDWHTINKDKTKIERNGNQISCEINDSGVVCNGAVRLKIIADVKTKYFNDNDRPKETNVGDATIEYFLEGKSNGMQSFESPTIIKERTEFGVKYIADKQGAIIGSDTEPVKDGDSPTGTQTPNPGYELKNWTCNKNITLVDGTRIIAGNPITEEQLRSVVVTEPLEFISHYRRLDYDIAYTLNGGTVAGSNPATYNVESESFTLINPTREGYKFKGWTGTDLTEPTVNVTVTKGSTGDRAYTAVWDKYPEITANNATVGEGTSFENALKKTNASASDEEDRDITTSITVKDNGGYDSSKPGDYTVTLKVTDSAGNTAEKTVVITVDAKPAITAADKTVAEGTSLVDAVSDTTASDNEDGDITSAIQIKDNGGYNPSKAGTYNVTLQVTDSLGQTTEKQVAITVNAKPEINASDKTVKEGTSLSEALNDASASDNEDGNITANLTIKDDGGYNPSKAGTYDVVLEVTDNLGQTTEKTVQITVDSKPNIVTDGRKIAGEGTSLRDAVSGITVSDNEDGDITSDIQIVDDGGYNSSKAGTYDVKLKVTDSAGNTVEKTVQITVDAKPVVKAKDRKVKQGTSLKDALSRIAASDNEDGNITAKIKVKDDGGYNPDKAGTYTVTVAVTDSFGQTIEKTVQITVREKLVLVKEAGPNTGDNSNIPLLTLLLVMSAAGAGFVGYTRKKER